MAARWLLGLFVIAVAVVSGTAAAISERVAHRHLDRCVRACCTCAASVARGGWITQADVDAWLDGLVPFVLQRDDIAGAVVVVIVGDGLVLTQRGFGYADVAAHKPVDPSSTLFRIGSISKLFTWTAVMQQVESGKID